MSLRETKNLNGIPFPKAELDLGNLTVKQVFDKINGFYQRFDELSNIGDSAESYFLQLLASYPVSMCSCYMTDTLKLIIALIYFDNRPSDASSKVDEPWLEYSFEDLSVIFDRSKASIHAAIEAKETEARSIIQEARLRKRVKKVAVEQLIEEEMRLKKEQENAQVNE